MINEVRVYDRTGKLLRRETNFEYDAADLRRRYLEHPCKRPGCEVVTNRKYYCSEKCSASVASAKAKAQRVVRAELRARLAKTGATHSCQICGKPTRNLKNCSRDCLSESKRVLAMRVTDRCRTKRKIKMKGKV